MSPYLIYYITGVAGLSLIVGIFLVVRNFRNKNQEESVVPISDLEDINKLSGSENHDPRITPATSNFSQHVISENLKTPGDEAPKPFASETSDVNNFQIQELQERIVDLTNANQQLNEALKREMSSKADVPVINSEEQANIADLETENARLIDELSLVKNQNEKLESEKEILIKAKETLNLEKDSLFNQIKNFETNQNNFEAENTELKAKIAANDPTVLNQKVLEMEQKCFSLQQSNKDLGEQMASLSTENQELKANVIGDDNAKHKITALEEEILRLREEHDNGLNSYRSQNKQLIDQVNELKDQLQTKLNLIVDLEKKIHEFQSNEGKFKLNYEKDIEHLKNNMDFLQNQFKEQIAAKDNEIQQLQSTISNSKGVSEEQIQYLEQKIAVLNDYQQQAAERDTQLRYELTKTKAQNVALSSLLKNFEQQI